MKMEKICPLKKATDDDMILFQNVEISEESQKIITDAMLKGDPIGISVKTGADDPPTIGPLMGRCERDGCAWWSRTGECCSVTYLASIAKFVAHE